MTNWLRAADCALLQPEAEADALALRLAQRLLELALVRQGSDDTAKTMLEEIGAAVRADQALLCDAVPSWHARWHWSKRGPRPAADSLPRDLLAEVLDRE